MQYYPQFKNTGKHSEVFCSEKIIGGIPGYFSKYWTMAKLKFVSSKKTWVSHLIYMMMYMTWWPTGLMIVTESLSFINIRLWYIIYRLVPSKQLRHYWVRSPKLKTKIGENTNRWLDERQIIFGGRLSSRGRLKQTKKGACWHLSKNISLWCESEHLIESEKHSAVNLNLIRKFHLHT